MASQSIMSHDNKGGQPGYPFVAVVASPEIRLVTYSESTACMTGTPLPTPGLGSIRLRTKSIQRPVLVITILGSGWDKEM